MLRCLSGGASQDFLHTAIGLSQINDVRGVRLERLIEYCSAPRLSASGHRASVSPVAKKYPNVAHLVFAVPARALCATGRHRSLYSLRGRNAQLSPRIGCGRVCVGVCARRIRSSVACNTAATRSFAIRCFRSLAIRCLKTSWRPTERQPRRGLCGLNDCGHLRDCGWWPPCSLFWCTFRSLLHRRARRNGSGKHYSTRSTS